MHLKKNWVIIKRFVNVKVQQKILICVIQVIKNSNKNKKI